MGWDGVNWIHLT